MSLHSFGYTYTSSTYHPAKGIAREEGMVVSLAGMKGGPEAACP